MKNLGKILVMALLVSLFGVVAVSSLMAAPIAGAQTPQATAVFNGSYGIRWNGGLGAFEIFDASGFSYIGSTEYKFNENGDRSTDEGQATNTAVRYHIMQDIVYSEGAFMHEGFQSGVRHTVPTNAVVDGRGFTLKGFPIKSGTALFSTNNGAIQNLKVLSPTYSSGENVGIITLSNAGTIESCTVSGTEIDIQSAVNIASIAYSGSGIIRSCANSLTLSTIGEYAGGIAGNYSGTIFNCTNNASVVGATCAGGIVGFMTGGSVLSNNNYGSVTSANAGGVIGAKQNAVQIKDNRNYAAITGSATEAGILGGAEYAPDAVNIADNKNYGTARHAEIYIGEPKQTGGGSGGSGDEDALFDKDIYHIEGTVFHVYTPVGLSYIGSGTDVTADGTVGSGAGVSATTGSQYYIKRDLIYKNNTGFFSSFISDGITLDNKGLVDGGNFSIIGFPFRTSINAILFNVINTGATVQNINLKLNTITDRSGSTGLLSVTNNGTVQFCSVSGVNAGNMISGSGGLGGISYDGKGSFKNITTDIMLSTTGANLGGIAASSDANARFTSCTNLGELQGNSYIGGIVGRTGNTTTISDCLNYGNIVTDGVRSTSLYVGGICGSLSGGTVKDSGSFADVRVKTTGAGYVGGVIGYVSNSSTLSNNKVSGNINVSSKNPEVGGVVGEVYLRDTSVFGCDWDGEISVVSDSGTTGTSCIGGVVGYAMNGGSASKPAISVTSCNAQGRILGSGKPNVQNEYWRVAGVIGRVGGTDPAFTIESCSFVGSIELHGAESDRVRGVVYFSGNNGTLNGNKVYGGYVVVSGAGESTLVTFGWLGDRLT